MSAIANGWAMSRGADTAVLAAAGWAAGIAVPGLIASATFTWAARFAAEILI